MLGTAGTMSEMIPKLGAQRSEALHAAIRLVGFQDGRVSGGLDSIRTIAGVCRNATLYMQEKRHDFRHAHVAPSHQDDTPINFSRAKLLYVATLAPN